MRAATIPAVLARLTLLRFPEYPDEARASLVAEKRSAYEDPQRFACFTGPDEATALLVVSERARARAWIVGVDAEAPGAGSALDAVCDAIAREAVAPVRLRVGGPPGCYLASGVAADDDAARALFLGRGFEEAARHVDLHADLFDGDARSPALPVRRVSPGEAELVLAWIAAEFAPAWAEEARRAFAPHDGLFVAGEPGAYAGFAAHSGNNASLGTFGPIGVAKGVRGGGLGSALCLAALGDLRARGFARATIPWVDPAVVRFYAPLVRGYAVRERVVFARTIGPAARVHPTG